MASFERSYKVYFDQCDMAGIVFFPNYLVMFNRLFEEWFGEALKVPLGAYHAERHLGFPFLNLQVSFHKPSRVGDLLDWRVQVRKIGLKSVELAASASCGGELRIEVETTMVAASLVPEGVLAQEIPADIRTGMEAFLEAG